MAANNMIENKNRGHINILHQNVQSLHSNYVNLIGYLDYMKLGIDIIALTETWNGSTNTYVNEIEGYINYCKQSKNRAGGIVLYVKDSINHRIINWDDDQENYDGIGILIKTRSYNLKGIILIVVYRHNISNIKIFKQSIIKKIEEIRNKYSNHGIVLTGDINIDLLKQNKTTQKFVNDIESLNLSQIIKTPTRVTKNSKTLIDHFYVDNTLLVSSTKNEYIGIGDHHGQLVTLQLIAKEKNKLLLRRCYTEPNKIKFVNYMKNRVQIWKDKKIGTLVDSSGEMEELMHIIQDGVDLCFPFKTIRFKNKNRIEWFTKELHQIRKVKDRLYKKWKISNLYIDELNFKNKDKQFKQGIKEAENRYINSKILQAKNTKQIWKVMNQLCGKDNKNSCDLEINDENGYNLKGYRLVNYINKYFNEIASDLVKNKPDYQKNRMEQITIGNTQNDIFKFRQTNKEEIKEIIDKLNKNKSSNDNYNIECIKLISDIIAQPISDIINKSMEEGKFPKCLKISTILPIYKSGDKNNIENYRPISLTSIHHKIIEKTVYIQLWTYVKKYKIIQHEQFAFQKENNCINAILNFNNYIYENAFEDKVVGTFLDIRKAYDSINHRILLVKLYNYGFRGKIYTWLEDYMKDRMQEVKLGSYKSDRLLIKNGILQGSTLGCLLFLIYINDIATIKQRNINITIFADDTSILSVGKNIKESVKNANDNLLKIKSWMDQNMLTVNVQKTKCIKFKLRKKDNEESDMKILYDGKELEEVNQVKFLGIIIDKELKFISHIGKIIAELKALTILCYRIRDKLNEQAKKLFYYAHIYSRIKYGIEIYSNTTWSNLVLLDRMHKRIIKVLFNESRFMNMKTIYLDKQFLDLRHIIAYHIIMIGYRWANNKMPEILGKDFIMQNQQNRTRQYRYIYQNQMKNSMDQKILKNRVAKYWNGLPKNLKQLNEIVFKKELKIHLLKNIRNKIKGENNDKYF